MILSDLKTNFDAGNLKQALVTPYLGKWQISFKHKNGELIGVTSQRGSSRTFTALDSVAIFIQDIGFKEFTTQGF